jgi:hypothetical protein
MNQVSQEACLKLGLAAKQASTVRCEPYKFLLYETGSQCVLFRRLLMCLIEKIVSYLIKSAPDDYYRPPPN